MLDGTSLPDGTKRIYEFALVPEPGTGVLVALGVAGLAARRRRVR